MNTTPSIIKTALMLAEIAVFFCLALAISACGSSTADSLSTAPPPVTREGEQIFITDEDGRRWEITDAVRRLGFAADGFQFGSGAFAIQPINEPQYVCPGEANYPTAADNSLVIGTLAAAEPRAYPTYIMKTHEIVNETFGDAHVSVAY